MRDETDILEMIQTIDNVRSFGKDVGAKIPMLLVMRETLLWVVKPKYEMKKEGDEKDE